MAGLSPRVAFVASVLLHSACSQGLADAGRKPEAPATAASAAAPPRDADEAASALIAADTFEDVGIGYDGQLSPGVRAFRVVFAAKGAADRFREIRARGTLVGQLYATIGLRHYDPVAYAEAVQALRLHADERVATRFGCLGGGERVGDLLESTKPSAIRLSPGQTFQDWMAIHGAGETDIVGGSFTSEFGQVPSRL